MKKIVACLFSLIYCFSVNAQSLETFHDFSAVTIVGDTISLSQYAGKKVLVVNTATFCGFTHQYEDLVVLDSLYGGPNFEILGFPCNDFGAQEPYNDSTILAFAVNNYNVQFQMMHKISIAAFDTLEVYKWLQLQSRNGVANAQVNWNFNKFCIDELGHWVAFHDELVSPTDPLITNWITSPTGITSQNTDAEIKLIQNPSNEKIQLRISNSHAEKFSVQLFDVKGVMVGNVFSGVIAGTQLISYSTQRLNAGIYILKIVGNGINQTQKVSVVK